MTRTKHYTLAFILNDTDASLTVLEQPENPADIPTVKQYREEYAPITSPSNLPVDKLLYLWQQFLASIIMTNVGRAMAVEDSAIASALKTAEETKQAAPAHNTYACQGPDTCPYCNPIPDDEETDIPSPTL